MNSRNSVNKSNLINFSTGLSTLNQLDPKDEIVRFPFDHIYACHSEPGRRTVLPLDKQVEQASRLVVAEKEDKYFNFNKIHEHLNALEVKNKRLKDLLIYHLELVQQQNEAITKKDKLYQVLKLENNALKAKLVSTFGLSISSDHEMTYHPPEPTSTVTSETINQKSPQLVDLCPAITSNTSPERKNELKEIFERARISAQALIEKHNREIAEEANITQQTTCTGEMIDSRRSRVKKADCKEPQSQAKPRQAANRKLPPKTNPSVQRKKRQTTSKSTRCRSKQIVETSQAVGKSYQSSAFKKSFKYKSTGSLAECVQLIDTTAKVDPYQIGEADFQEVRQNPILKRKAGSLLYGNKKKKSALEDIRSDSDPGEDLEVDILNVTSDIERKEDMDYAIAASEPQLNQAFECMGGQSSLSQPMRHEPSHQHPSTSSGCQRTLSRTNMFKKKTKSRVKKGKRSPPPGFMAHEPFHTLIGSPDCDWGVTLASGVNEIFDHDLTFLSNVEVPQWRENKYDPDSHCVCAEFVNDKTFEKRHNKHEIEERRQLRWHMRRIREQRHMERLRQRHKDSWSNMPVSPPSVYTLWPRAQRDLRELQIALTLPVGAFGEDIPDLPHANFMLPWVRTSKALKRTKRSKTLR